MAQVIIVAALEREIAPLTKGWPRMQVQVRGRQLLFLQSDDVMVVVGGIGTNPARVAAEAAFERAGGEVGLVISAGLAGALTPGLHVGDVVSPAAVLDATDELTISTAGGAGLLVTSGSIASAQLKARYGSLYGALAVDMEAYAVADVAQLHHAPFLAVKAISDELAFEMPQIGRFIDSAGGLRTSAVAVYAALRPWLWPGFMRLGRNSALAAGSLGRELERVIADFRALGRYNKETDSVRKQD